MHRTGEGVENDFESHSSSNKTAAKSRKLKRWRAGAGPTAGPHTHWRTRHLSFGAEGLDGVDGGGAA
jgi:hypothetical protein